MNIISVLHQLFFPSFCVYCRTFLDYPNKLCKDCFDLIKPVVTCPLKISSQYEVKVFALGAYQEPLKSLILSKRQKQRANAQLLGELLFKYTSLQYHSFDVIVPIPLHWTRYAYRWFNQAYEMGKQISILANVPLVNVLKRIKKTPFQSGFSREQRRKNVEGVFSIKVDIKDKNILLIDDVMTTGATLKEAVKILKKQRPRSITIAVAARVV